jgi:TonB family protein
LVQQTQELDGTSDAKAQTELNASDVGEHAAYRLVIRAEIIPEEPAQIDTRPSFDRRALALAAAAIAVLLAVIWIGFSAFDDTSASNEGARSMQPPSPPPPTVSKEASGVTTASTPQPAPSSGERSPASVAADRVASTALKSAELTAPTETASPLAINEVVPDVPRSALQTIRGTVRVRVRVTLDKQGTVIAATAEDPGPSRYFERLSLAAAQKWTFAPTTTNGQRQLLVRFDYTRQQATARAEAVE